MITKKEVFDVIRTKIRSRREQYDGKELRELDARQEVEKDYDSAFSQESETTVRMWRPVNSAATVSRSAASV